MYRDAPSGTKSSWILTSTFKPVSSWRSVSDKMHHGIATLNIGIELAQRVADLKTRLPPLGRTIEAGKAISYTQWEAWLALYFGKGLLIAAPEPGVARDPNFAACSTVSPCWRRTRFPIRSSTSPSRARRQAMTPKRRAAASTPIR